MKILTLLNWALVTVYGLLLAYFTLTAAQAGGDAAGRAISKAYLLGEGIGLLLLVAMNLMPFWVGRLAVLVAVLGLIRLNLRQLLDQRVAQQTQLVEEGRRNGSFYFADTARQALARAIYDRDRERFDTLLLKPVPLLNQSGQEHLTLLDYAVLQGAFSGSNQDWVIPFLAGLRAKGATFENDDPLHWPSHTLACESYSVTLLEWFLKNGANPNSHDLSKPPIPLLLKVIQTSSEPVEPVKRLLDYGADPNAVYPPTSSDSLAGDSALLVAARLQAWEVCQLLLEKGADPRFKGPQALLFTDIIQGQAARYAHQRDMPAPLRTLLAFLHHRQARHKDHN